GQLECLDAFIAAKKRIASRYVNGLQEIPGVTLPVNADWAESVFWLYTIMIDAKQYGMNSRQLMEKLIGSGVQVRPFWHPIYSLKPYQDCYSHRIEVADKLYQNGLSLPSSVGLCEADQDRVIKVIQECRKNNSEKA
ncbi:MAG: DegT/DnrJ/EryC1/StrS family aminotransferase, partial [Candidatus Margulisiibacteriota bacterium]